jgi:hypothetical protein
MEFELPRYAAHSVHHAFQHHAEFARALTGENAVPQEKGAMHYLP